MWHVARQWVKSKLCYFFFWLSRLYICQLSKLVGNSSFVVICCCLAGFSLSLVSVSFCVCFMYFALWKLFEASQINRLQLICWIHKKRIFISFDLFWLPAFFLLLVAISSSFDLFFRGSFKFNALNRSMGNLLLSNLLYLGTWRS